MTTKQTRKPKAYGIRQDGDAIHPSLNQHIKNGLDRLKASQDAGEQVIKELAELAKDGVQFGVRK